MGGLRRGKASIKLAKQPVQREGNGEGTPGPEVLGGGGVMND